jgi:hypothetical protein
MVRNIIEVIYSMEKLNENLNNGIVPPELDLSQGFGTRVNIDTGTRLFAIAFTDPMVSMRNVIPKRLRVSLDLTKWYAIWLKQKQIMIH